MKPQLGSLLSINQLTTEQIEAILALARRMDPQRPSQLLHGKRVVLLFYEASTRTRTSFEFAAKSLGAMTTLVTATSSSIEKGESLIDTGWTVECIGADVIVMRHPNSGSAHLLARYMSVPIVNAGDGMHQHPSQGLLDALTILNHKKELRGLRVVIVGDVYHSRVARSNAELLSQFGADVIFCGPRDFVPEVAATLAPGVVVSHDLNSALQGADVVMALARPEGAAGRTASQRRGLHCPLPGHFAAHETGQARCDSDASRARNPRHGADQRSGRWSAVVHSRAGAKWSEDAHGDPGYGAGSGVGAVRGVSRVGWWKCRDFGPSSGEAGISAHNWLCIRARLQPCR